MRKILLTLTVTTSLIGLMACSNSHSSQQIEARAQPAMILNPSADYTLIHSAWMGGWQWDGVGAQLSADKSTFIAPDLPGHGSDTTPASQITMDDYVKTLTDALDNASGQTILVGHSFGGVIASQVAEARPKKVKAIVYLCAFMLPNETSFMDATNDVTTSEVLNNLSFNTDGTAVGIKETALHNAVAHDIPKDIFMSAKSHLVLEPTAPLATKLSLSKKAYGSIPKYYVECTQDKAIPLPIQQAMHSAQNVENVYTVDSSHSVIFSQPKRVSQILNDISAREDLRTAVNMASQAWQDAFNSGNAEAAANLYEVDAVMEAKPFGIYTGRSEIQGFWENLVSAGYSDVKYLKPKLTILDSQTAHISSAWTMNNAEGIITNELWVVQPDGSVRLREDDFEVKN